MASISSCHMLTYLWLASRAGFSVASYEDHAVGVMTRNDKGIPWVSRIRLRVRIAYEGQQTPSAEEAQSMHHGPTSSASARTP